MQPSLRDIAESARVSRSTVSRALKNSPLISEKTTKHIHKIAAELGYKIDPLASKLMKSFREKGKGNSGTVIGWINEYPNRSYWNTVLFKKNFYRGALDQAKNLGIRIEPIWIMEPGMKGSRMENILIHRGIQGLIFPTPRHGLDTYGINWDHFAMTILSGRPETDKFTKVDVDFYANTELLLEKLIEFGYRKIGLAISDHLDWASERKVHARFVYHNTLVPEDNRVPVFEEKDLEHDGRPERFINWVKTYQPDCIVTFWKEAFDWLKSANYEVPKDIGLASYNVTEETFDWSGIRTNQARAGAIAINSVLSNLARFEYGPGKHHARTVIKGFWAPGSTVVEQ